MQYKKILNISKPTQTEQCSGIQINRMSIKKVDKYFLIGKELYLQLSKKKIAN